MVDTKHCYSIRQFAEKAGVSKEAVRLAIEQKKIKADQVDTIWLIPKSEVSSYLKLKRKYPKTTKKKK